MKLYYITGIENGAGEYIPFTTTAFTDELDANKVLTDMQAMLDAPDEPKYSNLRVFEEELRYLSNGKTEAKLYTEDDMNAFAEWYINNTRQYSDDSLALSQGKYLEMWLNTKKK